MEKHDTAVQEALDWLKSFERFHIRPGLARVEAMLDALGRPERHLRFIHIAGTNGKGSTGACLAQLLREHGYNVGVFSSPAISHELDRIKYNECRVTEDTFLQSVAVLRRVIQGLDDQPTEFEVITVLAIHIFQQLQPDWIIWETGLGGRYDSTNVVTPELSLITHIGFDHTSILGQTLQDIAREKAGIIKQGVPVLTAVDQNEALMVIRNDAERLQAPLYILDEHVHVAHRTVFRDGQLFSYTGLTTAWDSLWLSLRGLHQIRNASLSLLALEVLVAEGKVVIDESAVRRGLRSIHWPGRMELVNEHPAVLLDAAHNYEAALQLVKAVQEHFTSERLHLIFGIFDDKPVHKVAQTLGQLADTITVTAGVHPRFLSVEQLAEIMTELFPTKRVYKNFSPQLAMQAALDDAQQGDLVLVAGSHELMSIVRQMFDKRLVKRA